MYFNGLVRILHGYGVITKPLAENVGGNKMTRPKQSTTKNFREAPRRTSNIETWKPVSHENFPLIDCPSIATWWQKPEAGGKNATGTTGCNGKLRFINRGVSNRRGYPRPFHARISFRVSRETTTSNPLRGESIPICGCYVRWLMETVMDRRHARLVAASCSLKVDGYLTSTNLSATPNGD